MWIWNDHHFFTYICGLFNCFCETQRQIALCGDRVHIHIGCEQWRPLSLNTSNTRRNVWYPQPSSYPTTHWHQKKQNPSKREEVSLEPTPPFKRIYIPPSIKVLFQQNQCKSSFRKFTKNIHQNIHLPA